MHSKTLLGEPFFIFASYKELMKSVHRSVYKSGMTDELLQRFCVQHGIAKQKKSAEVDAPKTEINKSGGEIKSTQQVQGSQKECKNLLVSTAYSVPRSHFLAPYVVELTRTRKDAIKQCGMFVPCRNLMKDDATMSISKTSEPSSEAFAKESFLDKMLCFRKLNLMSDMEELKLQFAKKVKVLESDEKDCGKEIPLLLPLTDADVIVQFLLKCKVRDLLQVLYANDTTSGKVCTSSVLKTDNNPPTVSYVLLGRSVKSILFDYLRKQRGYSLLKFSENGNQLEKCDTGVNFCEKSGQSGSENDEFLKKYCSKFGIKTCNVTTAMSHTFTHFGNRYQNWWQHIWAVADVPVEVYFVEAVCTVPRVKGNDTASPNLLIQGNRLAHVSTKTHIVALNLHTYERTKAMSMAEFPRMIRSRTSQPILLVTAAYKSSLCNTLRQCCGVRVQVLDVYEDATVMLCRSAASEEDIFFQVFGNEIKESTRQLNWDALLELFASKACDGTGGSLQLLNRIKAYSYWKRDELTYLNKLKKGKSSTDAESSEGKSIAQTFGVQTIGKQAFYPADYVNVQRWDSVCRSTLMSQKHEESTVRDKYSKYLILDLETTAHKMHGRVANCFSDKNRVVLPGLLDYKGMLSIPSEGYQTSAEMQLPDLAQFTVIIGHNIKFDLLYLWKQPTLQQFFERGGKVWDTLYAEYLLTGQKVRIGRGAGLDVVAPMYGGTRKIDHVKEAWKKGLDTSDIPVEILAEYLAGDLKNTEILFENQIKKAVEMGSLTMLHERMDFLLAACEAEYNGLMTVPIFQAPETDAAPDDTPIEESCERNSSPTVIKDAPTNKKEDFFSFGEYTHENGVIRPECIAAMSYSSKVMIALGRPFGLQNVQRLVKPETFYEVTITNQALKYTEHHATFDADCDRKLVSHFCISGKAASDLKNASGSLLQFEWKNLEQICFAYLFDLIKWDDSQVLCTTVDSSKSKEELFRRMCKCSAHILDESIQVSNQMSTPDSCFLYQGRVLLPFGAHVTVEENKFFANRNLTSSIVSNFDLSALATAPVSCFAAAVVQSSCAKVFAHLKKNYSGDRSLLENSTSNTEDKASYFWKKLFRKKESCKSKRALLVLVGPTSLWLDVDTTDDTEVRDDLIREVSNLMQSALQDYVNAFVAAPGTKCVTNENKVQNTPKLDVEVISIPCKGVYLQRKTNSGEEPLIKETC